MPTVAASSVYVCVADNEAVDVYAVATLKLMFRAVPTDAFVMHMFVRNHSLHVIDVAGTYAVVDLRANSPRPARSLISALAPAAAADEPKTLATARSRTGKARTAGTSTSVVRAGHFFAFHVGDDGGAAGSELWFALLLSSGELQIHPARPSNKHPAATIGHLPFVTNDIVFTVGLETGVISIAVRNDHVVRIFAPSNPCTYGDATVFDARVEITALAAHPSGFALAIGGRRGEMNVLQDVGAPADGGFSDHWHHTAVSALLFTNGGNALLSGAAEGTVCLWSLADFSMIKTRTQLDTVHALTAATDLPSLIAIPGGAGGLALLDLMERRIVRRRDSVHWSSTHPCRGVVVADWFGTKAAILTGLPDVLRIYDPVGHDTLHSLIVTPAMETVARPPNVGVTHTACARGGKLIVTFEDANDIAMPSVLRWWRWDGRAKAYKEEQCVYAPHGTEPLLSLTALTDQSIITVSATSAKCWAPLTISHDTSVTAAIADLRKTKMHAVSSVKPTHGRRFTAFALSDDGSVAFVAEEDVVRAYVVSDAAVESVPWPAVMELSQNFTDAAFHSLALIGSTGVVGATQHAVVFFSFDAPAVQLARLEKDAIVQALCTAADDGFAVVTNIKSQATLQVYGGASLKLLSSASLPMTDTVAAHAFGQASFIVVSKERGLKVVTAQLPHDGTTADTVRDAPATVPASSASVSTPSAGQPSVKGLAAFFKRGAASASHEDDSAAVAAHQRLIAAREYLQLAVGQGEAYAAPPAHQLLEGYLAAVLARPMTDEGDIG